MKNSLFLYLVVLTSTCTFSQKSNTALFQKEWLEAAKRYEAASDYKMLMSAYHYAFKENPETPEGKASLKKSDSLKSSLRTNTINGIQGSWKLTTSGSNWGYEKVNDQELQNTVTISGTLATFYEKDLKSGEQRILKEINLTFLEVDTDIPYNDYHHSVEFIYPDKTIWKYTVTSDNLSITEVGELNDKFVSVMVCGNSEYYYSRAKH